MENHDQGSSHSSDSANPELSGLSKVAALRRKRGWTLGLLSMKSGIPIDRLKAIEARGRFASIDEQEKLAWVLGVDWLDLVD